MARKALRRSRKTPDGSVRTTLKGKRTTFSVRDGKAYVAGKLVTGHKARLARSLVRQQVAGLKPSIQAARGHVGERSTASKRRKAFYEAWGGVVMSQDDIEANDSINQGVVKDQNGKTYSQTWAATWRTASLRKQYTWYALVRVFPILNEAGEVGSGDEEGDEGAYRSDTPMDLILHLIVDGKDIPASGYSMDDIIEGFEQNVVASMQRFDYEGADKDTDAPVPIEDVASYLIGVFRHRRAPSDIRK